MTVILGCMPSARRTASQPNRPQNALIVIIMSINRHIDIAYFGPWLGREWAAPGRKRRGWLMGYHQNHRTCTGDGGPPASGTSVAT